MQSIGKYLIVFGAIILIAGLILTFFPKLNFFGRLPGDITVKKENFSFYFPIVTSIVLSILLTLIFWIINFFMKK
jgi:cobalamin synthase